MNRNHTDFFTVTVCFTNPQTTPASVWRATGEDLLAIETMQRNSSRRSVGGVNAASAMGGGGASGGRRREAPGVVIGRGSAAWRMA